MDGRPCSRRSDPAAPAPRTARHVRLERPHLPAPSPARARPVCTPATFRTPLTLWRRFTSCLRAPPLTHPTVTLHAGELGVRVHILSLSQRGTRNTTRHVGTSADANDICMRGPV